MIKTTRIFIKNNIFHEDLTNYVDIVTNFILNFILTPIMNKTLSKLVLAIIISFIFNGQAFAVYKNKVIVTEFDDPPVWKESYSPGKNLSNNLKQKLIDSGQFHILPEKMNDSSMRGKMPGPLMMDVEPAIHYIPSDSLVDVIPIQGFPEGMMGREGMMEEVDTMPSRKTIMDDPVPWPVPLGSIADKASLFEIRGQVVKFDQGNMDATTMDKGKTSIPEKAELEVMLQFIQNKTGRVVYKRKFRAFSNSGQRPFSKDIDLGLDQGESLESSSMSLAFSFLINEMVSFVKNTIFTEPLEGEIIAIKNEDVLINVGRQNGVKVGDKFRVHSVGLQLSDPLTEYDLGDIYVKMGAIQVLESMLGFSRARIIVGKDFMPGNMVRSYKQSKDSTQQFSGGEALSESKDPVPWWSFHKIKPVP